MHQFKDEFILVNRSDQYTSLTSLTGLIFFIIMEASMPASRSTLELTPVPMQKASEAIYEQISDMIMTGKLKPGDRLPSERAMMEQLQRSRPTIREALRMLERSGLIRTIPGSNGAVVMEPSTTSVEQPLEQMIAMNRFSHEELLEVRSLFEKYTVEMAAERRTQEDLDKLKNAIDTSGMNLENFDEFFRLDLEFHQAIANAAHNNLAAMIDKVCHRIILDILKASYNRKDLAGRQEMVETVLKSHRLIYEAIEKHDAALAVKRMEIHINRFAKDVMNN